MKEKINDKKYPRKDMYLVPLAGLAIENGLNKRFHYGDLQGLADSIKENGVIQPLHVFSLRGDSMLYIMDGHRRFKAAKLAASQGWEGDIPVLKFGRGVPTEEEKTLAIITHNGGKPLNLLEEGMVYSRLLELGLNNSEIARKVGKSVTHIISCSGLLKLKEPLLEKIKNGVVTATMVLEELKNFSEDELDGMISEAVTGKELSKVTKKHLKIKAAPKVKTLPIRMDVDTFMNGVIKMLRKQEYTEAFIDNFAALQDLYNGKLTDLEFLERIG